MTLGGTQGLATGGAVWGRIWCPDCYDEWIPPATLRSGTVVSATDVLLTVDVSGGVNLNTLYGGLKGRWVLVTDAEGENAQYAYINSNTVDTITIASIVGTVTPFAFNPIPVAGWKFYLGLIEFRWGPKRMEFGDPDLHKKVDEVHLVMSDYTSTDLPIIRLYRGMDSAYTIQKRMIESKYIDGNATDGLYSRYDSHIGDTPRWGVSVIDRSYAPTTLKSLTVIFHTVKPGGSK
jgi:hypothetical protein